MKHIRTLTCKPQRAAEGDTSLELLISFVLNTINYVEAFLITKGVF